MRIIFTPLAERQIAKLHEYIAAHASEERADGYINRIVDYCHGFTTFSLGPVRNQLLDLIDLVRWYSSIRHGSRPV